MKDKYLKGLQPAKNPPPMPEVLAPKQGFEGSYVVGQFEQYRLECRIEELEKQLNDANGYLSKVSNALCESRLKSKNSAENFYSELQELLKENKL